MGEILKIFPTPGFMEVDVAWVCLMDLMHL